MPSDTSATFLIVLLAIGILSWGFYRARPFGKIGILSWLQSVSLMVPWVVFFTLFALGIYINLVGVLLLLGISTGAYIYLGKRLRAAGQELARSQRLSSPPPNQSQEAEAEKTVSESDSEVLNEQSSQPTAATPPPTSVPPLPIPEVVPVPPEDLEQIQGIFGIDTFFTTETISYQEGAIFKGNLRGEVEATYEKLSTKLSERVGERYRLFLVDSPDGKPVCIVLPSNNDPKPTTTVQKLLAVALLVATFITAMEAGGILLGFDFFVDWGRYREVLPVALGIFAVLGAHELGHFWMARRHQVRLSPPFLLPTWQIGSFGALTRFESLLPNRSVLFDIALAGPAAGGLVAFVMLLAGLLMSGGSSPFQMPSGFFQGSILVGSLARVVLGNELQQATVPIHPLTVIGWMGLMITAINLMPAGQLDGGRIVQAIYGRKVVGRTTVVTLIVLAIASLVNLLALYWAIIILFLQRDLERPSLNELTEPDDARAALGLLALFLTIATLFPLTPSLAGRLGIGI